MQPAATDYIVYLMFMAVLYLQIVYNFNYMTIKTNVTKLYSLVFVFK